MAKRVTIDQTALSKLVLSAQANDGVLPIAMLLDEADRFGSAVSSDVLAFEEGRQKGRKMRRKALADELGEKDPAVIALDAEIAAAADALEEYQRAQRLATVQLVTPDPALFTLQGLVLGSDGRPAAGAVVIAFAAKTDFARATTDKEGGFVLRVPVSQTPGETEELAETGRPLSIRIEDRSGASLRPGEVFLPMPGLVAYREYTLPAAPGTAPPRKEPR